ncbi:uncharacterized protein N7515_006150 [Penicillium bovifimosum]|uniref:Uncharacterized protein n=1 Tax=Penicillium bovifimosum TaxID=126998 RepID=A0A9W9GUF1_9EURO|nr:uncharacterized protein N7515_006150 [Penicillium bovifimosum]KAJ5130111.1 hypothetical protein N7515_006150 [Penicillium bovifimosum]
MFTVIGWMLLSTPSITDYAHRPNYEGARQIFELVTPPGMAVRPARHISDKVLTSTGRDLVRGYSASSEL